MTDSPDIEALLAIWGKGEGEALPLPYAAAVRAAPKSGPPTASKGPFGSHPADHGTVYEAYLRLHRDFREQFQNKSRFIATCALLLGQILVGYEGEKRLRSGTAA